MDKKIQNELYKDLKLALKIDKGLDHYTDDEIEKKITNSFLLPYVSLNFGDGSDNDTNFLTNLNKEDAPPFGELLKRSGINLEKSDKTSDMENFFKTVASYSSAFLWHELSTKYSKEEIEDAIKEVFKEKGIEKLFKIDSWGILFGKGLTQKNPILDNEELFETKGIDEGTNAYLMLKTVSQKLYNSSNKKEFSEEVQQAIDGIIERMEVVYKDLWGKKLIGVLMPEGKIAYSNKSKKKKYRKYLNNPNNPNEKKGSLVVYLKNISNSWFELLNVNWDTMGINSEGGPITKAFNDDGSMREYNYIPNMHLKHISNRTKWTKEYRPKLIENIGTLLSKTEKEDGIYSNVVEQLTIQLTSFLGLLDVNDHTIQLRATNLENIKNYEARVTEYLKKNATGSEGIKLMTSHVEVLLGREEITKDIFNLTAIYSLKAFQQEVLFAHKLYNGSNPVIPKITSPVLGVKFDGTLLRDNLFSDTFTSIIAGSRSGKGTLTMSLLGPLLAQGQSIIYLDNKPDIACLFWNLERSYSEKGKDVKFLCIDAKEQESTFDKGNRANRGLVTDEYGEAVNLNNVPSFLENKGDIINKSTGFLHLLRIYKTLQLVFAIGNTFSKDNIEFDNDPIYVFIDEITDLQDRMEGLYHFIDSQTKINTAKREPKMADYAHKLAQVVKDVSNALSTIRKMASDKQNIKIVTIGQTISKEWSTDTSEVKNAKIGSLNDSLVFSCLGKTKNWLSGRGQLDPVTYKLSKTEEKFINTPGVFMKHTKKPYAPIGNIQGIGAYNSNRDDTIKGTLFRSYFALVKNDIEDRYETVANFRTEDELKEYFNANAKSGYTNLFLNYRYKGYGYEDYMNSIKELFDEEQGKAIEGVGFEGLIQDVAKVLGKDTQSEDFIKGLNSGYNKIDTFFKHLGLYEEFGYNCIEDYLYDVSMESLFSQVELEERFKTGYNHGIESVFQKKEKPILEDSVFEDDETEDNFVEETNLGSEDIDFNNGNEIDETVEDITEIDKMNTTEETTTSKYEPKNNKTIPKPNKPTKAISRPSQSRAGTRTYSPNLEIEDNPFKTYGFDSKIGQAKGFKMLAELIENDIISMAGGLSRINNFRVNGDETLTIDSIHYSPQFPEDFLETLPFKFRTLAEEGRVSDFIDYSIVRNMDNLQSLEIESMTIANGKARQQMGLKKYQRYSSLFKKLKQLNYINICGVEYTNETVDFSDEPERTPFSLGNKLSNIFGFGKPKKKKERKGLNIPNPFGFAPTNELFDSRPVQIATSALGWTVGIKAVSLVATMLGPWGLVFGGLAAAKTYQTVKNPKPKKRKSPKPQKQKKEQAPPKIDPLEQDHNDLYS